MNNERQKKQFSLTITENYYCELVQHCQKKYYRYSNVYQNHQQK